MATIIVYITFSKIHHKNHINDQNAALRAFLLSIFSHLLLFFLAFFVLLVVVLIFSWWAF
jgi:hypothetical protein